MTAPVRVPPRFETDRLILRSPREGDAVAYTDFYADPEASAFYGGPLLAHDAWGMMARDVGHWSLRGYGIWVVERRDTGAVVGGCGLMWPTGWPRSELTWWILPDARRQGFAREASRAAIAFGYDTLGWERVETHMKDDNVAARALALSLGGTVIAREAFPDGLDRDIYALPRS